MQVSVTASEQHIWLNNDLIPPPPDETPGEVPDLPRPRVRGRSFLREVLDTIMLIVMIYTLVNLVSARFVVEGSSMSPNFATGQFIIVNRINYLLNAPQRGDVIVFISPDDPHRDFIKRIIGLPGETVAVRNGQVFINGEALEEPYIYDAPRYEGEWTLESEEYFVLGDNRNNSRDSHAFGPLPRDKIIGQAWLIYWPPEDWGIIPHYDYDQLSSRSESAPVPVP